MAVASARGRLKLFCADTFAPLERSISLSIRGRLGGDVAGAGAAAPGRVVSDMRPRVAVLGRLSAEFAAAVRGARAAGAVVAPLDVRRLAGEGLEESLAEAQVQLAVLAGSHPSSAEGRRALEAARRLGASTATATALADEHWSAGGKPCEQGPLLLRSSAAGLEGTARAAEVSPDAVASRVDTAVRAWGLTRSDVVLPLCVSTDHPCASLAAWDAPLAAGSRVALLPYASDECAGGLPAFPGVGRERSGELAPGSRPPLTPPSEMWAAFAEVPEATVLVTSARSLRPFLDEYANLAPGLRKAITARAVDRRVRLSLVLCAPGTVPSREVADRWAELVGCPLTWHFSCAEAGSLFSVGGDDPGGLESGSCAEGLDWQVDEELGELQVRGPSVFRAYQGRPRSTMECFDENGFFLRTGHRVTALDVHGVRPEPHMTDPEVDWAVMNAMYREPNVTNGADMSADWKLKKTPMRTFRKWRTFWGAVLLTKKDNQAHIVYQPKYHKRRHK